MHLEAIDNDLWYIVENGVPSVTPTINAADVKRFKKLDSLGSFFIHLIDNDCYQKEAEASRAGDDEVIVLKVRYID